LNICRALYSKSSILIFDDPLSALDAHVGKSVFHNILQRNASYGPDTTRIIVTHALHFLPQVDYIYTLVDGRLAEKGTYKELMGHGGAFAKFVAEFGGDEEKEGDKSGEEKAEEADQPDRKKRMGGTIMQAEERNTGAVSGAGESCLFALCHGALTIL
jgi:ABC-type multidrug transport system ATPase subunit